MGKMRIPDIKNLSWTTNKNNIMAHVRCEYFDPRGKVIPGHSIIVVDWLPLWWIGPHVEIKINQHIKISLYENINDKYGTHICWCPLLNTF